MHEYETYRDSKGRERIGDHPNSKPPTRRAYNALRTEHDELRAKYNTLAIQANQAEKKILDMQIKARDYLAVYKQMYANCDLLRKNITCIMTEEQLSARPLHLNGKMIRDSLPYDTPSVRTTTGTTELNSRAGSWRLSINTKARSTLTSAKRFLRMD